MGYAEQEATCIAGVLTETDNIVISESAYAENPDILRHERMHRRWGKLPEKKLGTLYSVWKRAAENGLLKSSEAAESDENSAEPECGEFCERAGKDYEHFYIYLCQGKLPQQIISGTPAEGILKKFCVR